MNNPPLAVSVDRIIDAPSEHLYDLISDITRMGEFSPENIGGEWLNGSTSAEVGARFKGTNRLGTLKWSTKPAITVAERGRQFEFRVPGRAGATWSYQFIPTDSGVRVVESMHQERRSPLPIRVLQRRAGVIDRAKHLRESMATTLDRLAAVAENGNSRS